ncbi:hypothetical protein M413DRAFT_183269 [Hebeloma cylindrosporum]|uniref:Uncharacterized protein n=1 Tax=Hebeloma cylindrosporum TaxID=76867 RepID=A0A0C3BSX4_HEBCY|nr:hypothetical protein M413DRAFT_183269 [Hebeloma cylindrosporum h7]
MSTHLTNDSVDILEAALDQAFIPPPRPDPVPQEAFSDEEQKVAAEEVSVIQRELVLEDTTSAASDDSWKIEYEAQVQSWRAQSAEAREKAEKERLKWESIRAIEREEIARRKALGIPDEPAPSITQPPVEENWQSASVHTSTSGLAAATSQSAHLELDSDLLSPSSTRPGPPTGLPHTHSRPDTVTDESQKWEDVPSITSSFPSMSFPDHIETPPSSRPQPTPQQAPTSATLAIFDDSLSTRTRLLALVSSLAVNLLIPFVNGVMLGFGEIVAKDVIMGWLGWKPSGPGSSVTNVGLRGSAREHRQKNTFR